MSEPFIHAEGVDGQLTLSGDRLLMSNKAVVRFLGQDRQGNWALPLPWVSAVHLQPAGAVSHGHLQLWFSPGRGPDSAPAGAANENRITFTRAQQPEFERIRNAIMARIHRPSRGDDLAAELPGADR